MSIGSTAEPFGGVPSLTDGEIISLYQKYLGRAPDSGELSSERENAMKYSAAGIERQIANRAGNAPNTGIRGDEGLAPLTVAYVPPPIHAADAGHFVTQGAAAVSGALMSPAGPTGTIYATAAGSAPNYSAGFGSSQANGISTQMILLLLAAAAAAYYFLVVRK